MAKEKCLEQAYLQVDDKKPLQVVFRPKPEPGEGRPANLVELAGAVFDPHSPLDKDVRWAVCDRIATLCREGNDSLNRVNYRNAAFEHLDAVHQILVDYMTLLRHEESLSPESADALLRTADDRLQKAIKCLGFIYNVEGVK